MFHAMGIALAMGMTATGATPPAEQPVTDTAGVKVTRPAADRYCIRVTTVGEQERLKLPLHHLQCKSQRQWAKLGFVLEHRGTLAAGRR